jgi:hypothetical protein
MNGKTLSVLGAAIVAAAILVASGVTAQAETANPVPVCTKWKTLAGLSPTTVSTWMAQQQATGHTQFVVPAADAGYSVMCAY